VLNSSDYYFPYLLRSLLAAQRFLIQRTYKFQDEKIQKEVFMPEI